MAMFLFSLYMFAAGHLSQQSNQMSNSLSLDFALSLSDNLFAARVHELSSCSYSKAFVLECKVTVTLPGNQIADPQLEGREIKL